MRIVIVKNAEELAAKAAEEALEVIRAKKDAVLGLATGSTPVGMYRKLIEDHKKNGTSYRLVKAVNLDEYIGLSPENDQSYRYFMRKNLFDEIDIDLDNTYIENCIVESRDTIRANSNYVGDGEVKILIEQNDRYSI